MNYFGRIKLEKGKVVERQITVLNITADDITERLLKDLNVSDPISKTNKQG